MTLAAVFLAVAALNAVFALLDHATWRSVTAGACAVTAAALLLTAVSDRRR
ncbi:hypothetical protein DFJ66_7391 [Saccharothrix variisporea]|uniref:Uncharacterized protein n=1 Tax=Saccharothrix variisporea TaxID=543527 RepID=A0A495XK36_9PSEU|nr:hypothetical protein DFJ66_7391 [Saccharothrix variisporea]